MEECKKQFIIKEDFNLSQGPVGPQGPPGPPGLASLPLSTDDVDYRGDVLTDVLDALLYVDLLINNFTANQINFEKGTVLTQLQFSWDYNKAIESQTITGINVVPPTLLVADRTKLVTLTNISTDTVVTLTSDDVIADAIPPVLATLTLSFFHKLYYGKRVSGTINSAFLLSLPEELKSTRQKLFSVDTAAAEYIWFCSPVSYGLPNFKANGFDGGFILITTLSFTNASGHTENYYVHRSINDNLGVTNVEVL